MSGKTTLTNQALDNLINKHIAELKKSQELTQEETKQEFNRINKKVSTMEEKLLSLKNHIQRCVQGICETSALVWAPKFWNPNNFLTLLISFLK